MFHRTGVKAARGRARNADRQLICAPTTTAVSDEAAPPEV